ncbi:pseudouridine synthase [Methyloprofundus sp.]|uniref:pseudouridine synthase n=1 Tax=Methyloprofundus sp. TaxID=2020875 RepID=UPI003D0B6EF9
MPLQDNCFSYFKESIDSYALPESFTFPFYYEPHSLCVLAAKELQDYLTTQQEWQHNFGMTGNTETAIGKMFGVLLVQNQQNEIGYLSAFSGKLAGKNLLPNFVPPVFDLLAEDGFFIPRQCEINLINQQIIQLEKNPRLHELENLLQTETDASVLQLNVHREKIIAGRQQRKAQRHAAEIELSAADYLLLKEQLSKQSVKQKLQLRDLNTYWADRIQTTQASLDPLRSAISALKNQRKNLSNALQQQIFAQYQFLNIQGISKSLADIFQATQQLTPPAGAGECAAPKLLHYAFQKQMKPLAMAEFWWGVPPKSEIRKHQNFYSACLGKCQPILEHMLDGITLDENPLLSNPAHGKHIGIVYQDDVLLVINKPAEFLSVPGKNIQDSVYLRIKQSYPKATGPLIVHRLDMSTSGLMVIALNKVAHKELQKQFIQRTVKKRYVALLDGLLTAKKGIIDLPLRVDLDDRPRQLVCWTKPLSRRKTAHPLNLKCNLIACYMHNR